MKSGFNWETIQAIKIGRPNLGGKVDVMAYRMFEHSIRTVLSNAYGEKTCTTVLYDAGVLAGKAFCENELNVQLEFYPFIAGLQQKFKDLGIGIIRVEESDPSKFQLILTLEEDLDCSGLPVTGETVCSYDEGFLSGIMTIYTGKNIVAREIECWSTGSLLCRFQIKLNG